MITVVCNNQIILKSFENDLDNYSTYFHKNESGIDNISKAAFYLKSALDRMIASPYLDAFQMMRCLAKRIHTREEYTSNNLTLVSDKALVLGGSDIILNTVYRLVTIDTEGSFADSDLEWFSKVNYNKGIKRFLETYTSSDIFLLKTAYRNNVVNPSEYEDQLESTDSDPILNVYLGRVNVNLTLTAFHKNTVNIVTDNTLTLPEEYDTSYPLTLKSELKITAGVREFILDKSVKFTENALSILEWFNHIDRTLTVNGNTRFKFPNHFYSYKLDLISFNSGDTWLVSNIMVLPATIDK